MLDFCIFIDLAKAFDTVKHTLLLETLEEVGIRGNCLDLSDRILMVKLGRK